MKGRKPTPTKLKIALGNPGKRPLPANEPQPPPGLPPCPDWLHEYARAKWAEVGPALASLGIATSIDGDVLAGYCTAYAELRISTETLAKEGRYVKGATGALKPHPAVNQQRTAWKALKDFAALLGLDPSSRCRLNIKPPAEADPLEELIGRGKNA